MNGMRIGVVGEWCRRAILTRIGAELIGIFRPNYCIYRITLIFVIRFYCQVTVKSDLLRRKDREGTWEGPVAWPFQLLEIRFLDLYLWEYLK